MSKWYFAGCSISTTQYVGNDEAYPCLVGNHFSKDIKILAKIGNSNQTILTNAIEALLKDDAELVFVQISAPGRQKFYHSLYYQSNTLGHSAILPKAKWEKFKDVYRFVDGEYNQYVLLNQYVPILNHIANLNKKKIVYINGHLYFDPLFFSNDNVNNYYNLSYETKMLINFETEPDEKLKEQIEDIRAKLSVIDQTQWVNLTDPLTSSYAVDKGNDGAHPGKKSNIIFANLIINFLEKNGIR